MQLLPELLLTEKRPTSTGRAFVVMMRLIVALLFCGFVGKQRRYFSGWKGSKFLRLHGGAAFLCCKDAILKLGVLVERFERLARGVLLTLFLRVATPLSCLFAFQDYDGVEHGRVAVLPFRIFQFELGT